MTTSEPTSKTSEAAQLHGDSAADQPASTAGRSGRTDRRRLALFAAGVVGLALLVGIASNAEQFQALETQAPPARNVLPIEQELGTDRPETVERREDPVELPDSVVITIAVIGAIGLLYLLSRQRFSIRFRRPSMQIAKSEVVITDEEQAEAIAEIATDLIDELREGDSPRQAIQRAYAAVETGFGSKELARKPAETPLRYLDRIFGRHATVRDPLAQLTTLFQRARFSDEPVDETMREEAIEALMSIRDYYKASAWKKINSRRSKAKT